METGFHLASVDWLPPTASDISFYRNSNIGNVLACEFHISKADFEALARERGWLVKPLYDLPSVDEESAYRYTEYLPDGHPQRREPFKATISEGLFFEDRHKNGGGITVLYDEAHSMAYVDSSNR